MHFKKMSAHSLGAGAIILVATIIRFVLLMQGWPLTNSDEGTIGIMALHIISRGEHPIFFYGQHYMGAWEAYLAAGVFQVLGSSLLALRLVTLGMFLLFMLSLYLLSTWLFSRTWALVTLFLVGLTSQFVMAQELRAIGGYAETLLFSTVLFLCATWLALTYQQLSPGQQRWRWLAYAGWGLTAGLGFWSDLLILPVVVASFALIVLCCWRELVKPLPLLCLLLSFLLGVSPTLYYSLHAAPGQDVFSVTANLRASSNAIYEPQTILRELQNTFQISIPMMTGEPFCPLSELQFVGPNSPATPACNTVHAVWSLVYCVLWGISGVLAFLGIWNMWRKRQLFATEPALRTALRLHLARFLLLVSAVMSLGLFTFSEASLNGAALHARYILCVLVATPAIFWPLWIGLRRAGERWRIEKRSVQIICALLLAGFCGSGLIGTALAFQQVPVAVQMNQDDAGLIQELARQGIKHIYGSYWTCDKIAFESREQVVCAVLDKNLHVDATPNNNRYLPYMLEVQADAQAAYVFSTDPAQFPGAQRLTPLMDPTVPLAMLPAPFASGYTRVVISHYVIYIPD